jgi:hypothetical protein
MQKPAILYHFVHEHPNFFQGFERPITDFEFFQRTGTGCSHILKYWNNRKLQLFENSHNYTTLVQISIWGSVQSLRLFTKNQAITWLRKINTSQLIDRTNISDAGKTVHRQGLHLYGCPFIGGTPRVSPFGLTSRGLKIGGDPGQHVLSSARNSGV